MGGTMQRRQQEARCPMFEWLRLRRQGSKPRRRVTPREPAPKVDPLEELLRIVGEAQDHDAEDDRRLGDPKWRKRPISYPRRSLKDPIAARPLGRALWTLLVLGGAVAGRRRAGLAHVLTTLRVPVIVRAGEVVDVRVLLHPNEGRPGAAVLDLLWGRASARGRRAL